MPRQRSRSRSIRRCYTYESYSESSDDDRGRPITRLINLIRPRSRSAGININQNIYQGDTIYDEDTINGPVFQAGGRGRTAPRKAGNHNHHHHHCPRDNDESDDEDYYDDSQKCRCKQCEVAEMAERLRQQRENAKKEAKAEAKRIKKENDALERRLLAMELSRSNHLIRDTEDIELDRADCNRIIGQVHGLQQHIYRARSRSRPNRRFNPVVANVFG